MNKLIKFFIALLPFILVFLASLYQSADPDLGWHLKYGEYFFKFHQVLKTNIFSTEMANYHWVNSSWATDLVTFLTYNSLNFLGLTLLGAVVVTLTFFILSQAFKLTIWDQVLIFPLLLYLESPLNSISFRGQQLSLLFMAVLLLVLAKFQDNFEEDQPGAPKRLLWLLPLFILWSNFHGEFLLGLGLLLAWFIFFLITQYLFKSELRTKLSKKSFILILIFPGCILATLVNPFGVGIYTEALRHFGNPWQQYVSEWLPFYSNSLLWWINILFGFFMFYCAIFIFFGNNLKQKLPFMGIFIIIFIFSLLMRRYAWPAYYLAIPLILPTTKLFKPGKKELYIGLSALLLLISFFIIWQKKYPLSQFTDMNWTIYCQNYLGCSDKAAQFLSTLNSTEQSRLTFYDFGGWLIWNYPQIKPSIDGRMHLWQDDKTGENAFAKYYPIEQNWQDINETAYSLVFMNTTKPVYNRLIELTKEKKWQLLYQDSAAAIFARL